MPIDLASTRAQQFTQRVKTIQHSADDPTAKSLGWCTLALGAVEVIAPQRVANLAGINLRPSVVRLCGVGKIVGGMALLGSKKPAKWLWAKVAGDLLDLAVVGSAPSSSARSARSLRAVATSSIVGATVIDTMLAIRNSRKSSSTTHLRSPHEQLVHFLSDMYSVEQQALAQMVRAPDIAGVPQLAQDFRIHYTETAQQANLVQERLEANGGSPSVIKDTIMRLGGKGFLLFAAAMPETPGRLLTHSYSYEAMEWAGYQMLRRFAEHAGDDETVAAAESIGAQERTMMERLERGFDAAEEASHADASQETLRQHIAKHLSEVHAFERQSIQLLAKGERIGGHPTLQSLYRACLEETRQHEQLIERRLKSLETTTSMIKDSALTLGGINWGLFFQAQSDTPAKFAAFMYAVLHLEIGGCELLKRTASRISDLETADLCATLIAEKLFMAETLSRHFESAVDATLHP